ncbi:MAG: TIGR03936 family radical SAM-associated protein [Candidatus Nanopelagicales bacterium]
MRYARRGRLRFSSHRDFQRALERAIRRAGVPIAYSAGFSPHPKISYANSAPTGAASEAEYVEIGLTREQDPASVMHELDAALPPGLDIVDAVVARTPDFAQRLEASEWLIEFPDVSAQDLQPLRDAFWATDAVEVQRMAKSGLRTFDARGPVVRMEVEDQHSDQHGGEHAEGHGEDPATGRYAILHVVVRHVTMSVRPDDVLAALRRVADFEPPVPPRVTRLAQGPLDPATCTVGDPFAPDRGD